MPDRYGDTEHNQLGLDTATAELRAIAATIRCRYCGADIGQPCINRTLDHHPATRIPHTARLNDAQETPF